MGRRRRSSSSFYDLNLETDGLPLPQLKESLSTALQLGYTGVAYNHVVSGAIADSDACKIRPLDISALNRVAPDVSQSAKFHQEVLGVPVGRPFRQYTRLTVLADSAIHAGALNAANPVLRSYDLVSVRPTNQKVFEQACNHLEVDLISLDLCHRLPFRLKPPLVKCAIERGIHFEIKFSSTFVDPKARRELFANAQMLQGLARGQNIIVSSGARRSMDLRGPNDVANMATLFGLPKEAAKAAVSTNCEAVIMHGLMRRKAYKAAIVVENVVDGVVGSREAWFDVPKVWDPLSNSTRDFISLERNSEGFYDLLNPKRFNKEENDVDTSLQTIVLTSDKKWRGEFLKKEHVNGLKNDQIESGKSGGKQKKKAGEGLNNGEESINRKRQKRKRI